jgi:glycosyltransferase involved in cell wall biosynthesis
LTSSGSALSEVRRILFVSSHPPGRVPGQRFRFEQYLDFLSAHGFETTFSPLLRPDDYSAVYRAGSHFRKALIAGRGVLRRLADLARISHFDAIVIQREALQLGTTLFERAFGRSGARLLFDFDDATWIRHSSNANKGVAWLKRPRKTAKIIGLCDMVFAGNSYLGDYARRFNENVKIVPTTIDTGLYVRKPAQRDESRICVGWSGSVTTMEHFERAVPILCALRDRLGSSVYFKVVGDGSYQNDELGIRGVAWSAETEVEELSEIDIGIMPLPDDDWSRGKCGLKGLQYMALETPTVMSPVGVNSEIIEDGRNGYLASSTDEWVARLSALVESRPLRERLGRAARATVVERYSVEAQKGSYLAHLRELVGDGGSRSDVST